LSHQSLNIVIASEAKQSISELAALWIASSLSLLAMTMMQGLLRLLHQSLFGEYPAGCRVSKGALAPCHHPSAASS
jgi:hypothetical protein